MLPDTDYTWRIDEENSLGRSRGPEWHFRTGIPVVPGLATLLDPKDGDTGVSLTPILRWSSGKPIPATHEVYLGTSRNLQHPDDWRGSPPEILKFFEVGPNMGSLEPNTWYYWRIDEKNAAGALPGTVWSFKTGGMPRQAKNPSPSDGATSGVGTAPTLSWETGSGTDTHLIFFGKTKDSLKEEATLPAGPAGSRASFVPTIPEPGTYWWRIDEKNAEGTTKGPEWIFTTDLPAVKPLQAKIIRCRPDGKADATGGGEGHSPDKRLIWVDFAYATSAYADDGRKAEAGAATQKVELCIVDARGSSHARCHAVLDDRWLVYEKGKNSKKEWAPTADKILDSAANALPSGIPALTFPLPMCENYNKDTGKCAKDGFDYADTANKGKFVVLRVNGQTIDEARTLGGTCPLPYFLATGDHFEIYGTENTVPDPWAGLGLRPSCEGGGLYVGTKHCAPPSAFANLLNNLEGLTRAHRTRFGAPENQKSWQNGNDTNVCGGDCKGHVRIYPGLGHWTGLNGGPGKMAFVVGLP